MNAFSSAKLQYPPTRRDGHVDVLHGITVPDPYRWLEDVDSAETESWADAQNALAQSVLKAIPFREAIRERLGALSDYAAVGVPLEAGGWLFFTLQKPDARQPALCWVKAGGDDVRVAVDPEALAEDGTISVTEFAPSPCGRYLAYGLAEAGSDWQVWRVLDVETGEHLSDKLEWLKFPTPSWRSDSSGFFYGGSEPPPPDGVFKAAATNRNLRFHRIGDPQADDVVVLEFPDEPQWRPYGRVTADGRYLVISIHRGTYQENRISVIDLNEPERRVVDLMPKFDAAYTFLGNQERTLYFLTTHGAPLGRIVSVDINRPEPSAWAERVPESEGTIQAAAWVGERFAVCTLRNAVARLSIHDTEGRLLHDVDLPGEGSIPLLEGRESGTVIHFSYGDFVHPNIVLSHDVTTGETELFCKADLPFDPSAYETESQFVLTAEGVRVPVFLARKRGVEVGPETPTCLYGYGGFNIAQSPHFKIDHISWLDLGGQLAIACIRGGGEFGRAWHQAGARENRPNVFADFIAVAEWLIETKRTSIPKLAIYGRSNGGLLVGACMTKRPDLFGVCLPAVGVLDMLRFHLFTVGAFWISDYGSPDDPAMFPILQGYSPVHNVQEGTAYPPTLVTTADHDDRVFPAHSHKFTAALQAAQAGDAPILLRIDKRAGHGLGKPKGKLLDEVADRWTFAFAALGVEPQL